MTTRRAFAFATLAAIGALALAAGAEAQRAPIYGDVGEARAALANAQAESRAAAERGRLLEVSAQGARAAADRTAREAAALAARIQQSEAGIAAARARIAIATSERVALDRRLAERRGPLVRLTAALQKLARRPLALSALKPGSLRDAVYLRAILETTVPEVRQRTAALRGEIARGQRIESEARAALGQLRAGQGELAERRTRLAALESRQRLASRQASGTAARESERALALAEQARDLDTLVGQLGAAGSMRQRLAALPGPIMRPPRPEASQFLAGATPSESAAPGPAPAFMLPVVGRTVAGFGEAGDSGLRASGLSLAPAPGAQVVAPAAGRVAFAGPYRGYDRIVIVEHNGGFTSLVTGLARVDVAVGDQLVAGAPLGVAGAGRQPITFELRRGGTPVNPLDFVR